VNWCQLPFFSPVEENMDAFSRSLISSAKQCASKSFKISAARLAAHSEKGG
jgi:hypothetical protein